MKEPWIHKKANIDTNNFLKTVSIFLDLGLTLLLFAVSYKALTKKRKLHRKSNKN